MTVRENHHVRVRRTGVVWRVSVAHPGGLTEVERVAKGRGYTSRTFVHTPRLTVVGECTPRAATEPESCPVCGCLKRKAD